MNSRRSSRKSRSSIECLEGRKLFSVAWATGPTLPAPLAQAAVVADSTGVYTFGGGTTGVSVLGTGSTAWGSSSAADLPRIAPGAGYSSSGFVVFGGKSGEVLDSALSYDPTGNNTQDAALMNSSRWRMAYASDANGSVYAIGGQDTNGTILSSIEAFDGTTWTTLAPMPAARVGAAAVDDGNGHIFVFGGAASASATDVSNTTYEYTIAGNQWSTVAGLPTAVSNEAAALGSNGLIYVLGGISSSGTTAVVQVYDPLNNSWAYDTSLPAPVSSEGAATDGLGRINVVGGFNSAGQATANVWQSQRLNQPDSIPTFTSTPAASASASAPYSYQAIASGNPQPTFSLVSGPTGMKVDPTTGLVTWQPTVGQTGTQNVDIRATNRAGQIDQTFSIKTVLENTAPTAPTNVHVVSETTSSVTLGFTAATDKYGIAGYRVYWTYGHSGRGGGFTTVLLYTHAGPATTLTVPGLQAGRGYSLSVAAYNSSGFESARIPVAVSVYSLPTVYVYPSAPTVAAKHPFTFTVYATGNPAPSYSLESAPAGMTFNSATGAGSWTPKPTQTGTFKVTAIAKNAAGISKTTLTITVQPDAPALSYQINPTSGINYGLVGVPMGVQVLNSSLTASRYKIVSGPTGATINSTTGLISWTPTEAEAGTTAIDVRATNIYGSSDVMISFATYITPGVTNITVTNTTLLSPTISWTAPTGNNDAQITGYTISLEGYNGFSYVPVSFDTKSNATSLTMTGLTAGLYYYTPTITPYDASGHPGISVTGTIFTYAPNLPKLSYTGSPAQTIIGQPLNLTLTNSNTTLPVTFGVVSGPSNLTVDPKTGVVSWTPTLAQDGPQTATFSATNSVGTVTEVINLGVIPTGAPTVSSSNVTSTSLTVNWTPPTLNASQIVGYHMTVYVGNTHTNYTFSATTSSFTVPASYHGYVYVVWISAYDANGVDGTVAILNVPFP